MKRKFLLSFFVALTFVFNAMAQATEIKEANPADVSSIDAIMKAVYDVISGDAGQKRDWDGFAHCFTKTRG